jgi:hypothetical protein
MAKLETIFCALTLGMMNALLIAVALEAAVPVERMQHAQIAATPALADAPVA